MLSLPSVSLISLHSRQGERAVRALRYSKREIRFGAVKVLSARRPANLGADIEFCSIPELSRDEYNGFAVKRLNDYVDTSHCLLIQTDGFVINPHLWEERFLQYDYIGAPWPPDAPWIDGRDDIRVGNGGFSLRSKKLLEVCQRPECMVTDHEDINLSCDNRALLGHYGVIFAPVRIAMYFSREINLPELGGTEPFCAHAPADLSLSFGFHGGTIYPEKLSLLDSDLLDLPNG